LGVPILAWSGEPSVIEMVSASSLEPKFGNELLGGQEQLW